MSRGTGIVLLGLDGAWGCKNAVLNMRNERADYAPTWWRIGESLRDYFEVPSELPQNLLTLLNKLDAIEDSYPLRHFDDGWPEARSIYIFPQLGLIYQAVLPWAEMLLRAIVGLTLVPHGLRTVFGLFSSTGGQSHNLTEFVDELERGGYRPGKFWAPAIVLTQLVAGPMLALGLFTRLAACPIVLFLVVTDYERWRVGGFFWNKMGLEFTLLWTVAAFYFLVRGGGAISVDHLVIGREL